MIHHNGPWEHLATVTQMACWLPPAVYVHPFPSDARTLRKYDVVYRMLNVIIHTVGSIKHPKFDFVQLTYEVIQRE